MIRLNEIPQPFSGIDVSRALNLFKITNKTKNINI